MTKLEKIHKLADLHLSLLEEPADPVKDETAKARFIREEGAKLTSKVMRKVFIKTCEEHYSEEDIDRLIIQASSDFGQKTLRVSKIFADNLQQEFKELEKTKELFARVQENFKNFAEVLFEKQEDN